jgi:hypothetical protein
MRTRRQPLFLGRSSQALCTQCTSRAQHDARAPCTSVRLRCTLHERPVRLHLVDALRQRVRIDSRSNSATLRTVSKTQTTSRPSRRARASRREPDRAGELGDEDAGERQDDQDAELLRGAGVVDREEMRIAACSDTSAAAGATVGSATNVRALAIDAATPGAAKSRMPAK